MWEADADWPPVRSLKPVPAIEAAERDWAAGLGAQFDERELRQAVELLERVRHALGPSRAG